MKHSRWLALLSGMLLWLGWSAPSWHSAPTSLISPAHAQLGYNFLDLSYIRRVTWLSNEHYVERKQIQPKKMFREALKRIQLLVPAIMIRLNKKGDEVTLHVNQKSKSFKLRRFRTIFDVSHQLKPLFRYVKQHYKGQVKLRDIEFASIHGMLSTLDEHTTFLPPSYYRDMRIHTGGKFGGLGIVIQSRDGYLTVVSPMPDTPASRAGIKPLDRIVRIGDESTINMSLTEAVTKLRGKAGSKVVIWIMRKGFTQPKRFVIIRAEIEVRSVTYSLLKGNIGYIRIKNFQQNTTNDMHKALRKMHQQTGGEMSGLILDLRDNPGGLLDQAIKISDTFLRSGVIVTHAGGSSRHKVHRAKSFGTEPDYPLIVLVNQGSASASEIVAGALKNNNRALVLGQRTYGKGTVQVLYPISRMRFTHSDPTALKLTVAQYLTPGGISIQKIGIAPDISLQPVHVEKHQIQIANGARKKKKKKKLPSYLKGVQEQRKPLFYLPYLDKTTTAERQKRMQNQYVQKKKLYLDFEMRLARSLLRKNKKATRLALYKAIEAALVKRRKQERRKIHIALKKLGIRWEKPKKAEPIPNLQVSYRLLPAKPKKKKKGKKGKKAERYRPPRGLRVWAGHQFRLQVTVRNKGKKPLYRVRALTRSRYWFLNRKEFIFGHIGARRTKKWSVTVKLPKWFKSQVHKMTLEVHTASEAFQQEEEIFLHCHGYKRPRFAFSYAIEERSGNGDQVLQAGESVRLRISVKNLGPGKAPKVVGLLKNMTGPELFIERGRIRFGQLKPGQSAIGYFRFRLRKEQLRKSLSMKINIFDAELLTSVNEKLSLRLYPGELKPMQLKKQRYYVKERGAWIYGGSSVDAPRIARAPQGTALQVVGRLGPFFQLSIKQPIRFRNQKKRKAWTGWIYARYLSKKRPKAKKQRLKFYWQYKAPRIALSSSQKPLWVNQPSFTLKGNIRNNVSLRDVYVLVNQEKVFYRALRNRPKLKLKLKLKLKKGRNRILIAARETETFSGYRELIVYYHPKGSLFYLPSGAKLKQRTARKP